MRFTPRSNSVQRLSSLRRSASGHRGLKHAAGPRTLLVVAFLAFDLAVVAFVVAQYAQWLNRDPQEMIYRPDIVPAAKLKVGAPAPDFTLRSSNGKDETTLSSFRGKRPVVLAFGSYT